MSQFPLLRLPLVALRNVSDWWNPRDLYRFSQISQKTKKIAKSVSKAPNSMEFYIGYDPYVEIKDPYGQCKFYLMKIIRRSAQREGMDTRKMKPLSTEMFSLIFEIMEIFKSPMHKISFHTDGMSQDQLYSLILWINSLKQPSIPLVSLHLQKGEELAIFLKYFMKPTENLHIQGKVNFDSDFFYSTKGSPFSYLFSGRNVSYANMKPFEFSGVQFTELVITKADWVGLPLLLAFDFVTADFTNSHLSSEELNAFLKGWKEGRAHSRIEKFALHFWQPVQMGAILDGLSPMFENPDECKIQRSDGKIAVLKMEHENHCSIYVI